MSFVRGSPPLHVNPYAGSASYLVNGRRHEGEQGEAAVLDGGGEPVGDADAVVRNGEGHGGPEDGGECTDCWRNQWMGVV